MEELRELMNSPPPLLPFLYNSESQLLRIKQMDMLKTSVGRRQLWEKSWNKAYSDVFDNIGEDTQSFHDCSSSDSACF